MRPSRQTHRGFFTWSEAVRLAGFTVDEGDELAESGLVRPNIINDEALYLIAELHAVASQLQIGRYDPWRLRRKRSAHPGASAAMKAREGGSMLASKANPPIPAWLVKKIESGPPGLEEIVSTAWAEIIAAPRFGGQTPGEKMARMRFGFAVKRAAQARAGDRAGYVVLDAALALGDEVLAEVLAEVRDGRPVPEDVPPEVIEANVAEVAAEAPGEVSA